MSGLITELAEIFWTFFLDCSICTPPIFENRCDTTSTSLHLFCQHNTEKKPVFDLGQKQVSFYFRDVIFPETVK